MTQLHGLLLVLGVVMGSAGAALGQNGLPRTSVRDYQVLPINGDLATLLKEQLLSIKDLTQLPLAAELAKANPKQIEEMTQKFAKKLQENTPPSANKPKNVAGEPPARHAGRALPTPPPANANNDAVNLDKMTKNIMEWVEHTQVANLDNKTRESVAYQRFKERVARSGNFNKALAGVDWTGANGKGLIPDLGWLKLPSISPTGALPRLPSLDQFGGLRGLRPSSPSLPGAVSDWRMLLTTAVAVAVALIAWIALSLRGARSSAAARPNLGPWPVQPGQLRTPAQLVQAFEHLALLVLGRQARAANHRAIAESLGTTTDRAVAADHLATLYEKARYDPAAASLAPPDLIAARRELCMLAGLPENAPAPGAG